MTVLILERVPTSLRGELTRWMLELKAGVFVGSVSALVRDKVWELVCAGVNGGACMLVHGAANEQGFAIRTWGQTSRVIEEFEGLYLVRVQE